MADRNDIATVIHSALGEIGVTGILEVRADGDKVVATLDGASGDDVAVTVLVAPREDRVH